MRKYDLINLLIVLLLALMSATLSGLGNAANSIKHWYWIPFVLNIVVYVTVCVVLFRHNGKPKTQVGEGGGAALPAQNENEKTDNVTDESAKKKTGRVSDD